MTRIFLALLAVGLIGLPAYAANEQPPLINDQADKINYSYGHQLGTEILDSGIKFNPELVWQALNDGLVKAPPHMDKEEMKYFLELLREENL